MMVIVMAAMEMEMEMVVVEMMTSASCHAGGAASGNPAPGSRLHCRVLAGRLHGPGELG